MANFTFQIPDNKVIEFRDDFLRAHPIPTDDDGNPLMTALEWVRAYILMILNNERHRGRVMRYQDGQTPPQREDDAG